jgi:ABC-type lipoprotein release transport system permease subunit
VSAVWLRVRTELRSTWRTTIVVLVIVAIGAGSALAALAGARRTQTAMRRFVAYDHPEDASLFLSPRADAARLFALPQIARVTRTPYLMMSPDATTLGPTAVFGAADANAWRTLGRPMLVRGRMPGPTVVDQVVVDDTAERRGHLHIGSVVRLYAFSREQIVATSSAGFEGAEPPRGPHFDVHVVGVVRFPGDIAVVPINQDVLSASSGAIYTTPAFLKHYATTVRWPFESLPGMEIARVQLHHGAGDLPAFTEAVRRVGGDEVQILPGWQSYSAAAAVQRGADVEALALLLFAAIAIVVTLALVVLNIARMLRGDAGEYRVLAALGFTRRRLALVAFARPAFIAVAGTLLAVVFAVLLSPLTPIGLARQAEIHSGPAVNVLVLAAGAAAVMFVLVICAGVAAWMATRRIGEAKVATRVRRVRFGPPAADATRAEPALVRRLAIVGVAIATAGVAAAGTFASSLEHLADTPRQQGWNFDVVVGNSNDQSDQRARFVSALAPDPSVAGVASIAAPPEVPTIDGHAIGLAGFSQDKGALTPVMLDGAPPRSDDDIALGRASLRALHKRVGDRVDLVAGGHHISMRITGVVLQVSAGDTFAGKLDEGAIVTLSGLKRVEPDVFVTQCFVRFAPGVNRSVEIARLQREFPREVLQHINAQEVANLQRVDALPGLLAALLSVLAIATLANVLMSSVRRRRGDFAVLKAVGFVRAQLAGAVVWQTWTMSAIGVVFGIPIGIVLGRSLWRFVDGQIGSVQTPLVPAGVLLIAVAGSAVVATLVAALPAVVAARTRTAAALRIE